MSFSILSYFQGVSVFRFRLTHRKVRSDKLKRQHIFHLEVLTFGLIITLHQNT